jgi:uncharacterized membrane protein YphA (DoxX/SURF4 family)
MFLLARLLFGLLLAFMGRNHFLHTETMAGYAEAKGIPSPRLLVPVCGGQLLFDRLGIALGAFSTLAAGSVASFLSSRRRRWRTSGQPPRGSS